MTDETRIFLKKLAAQIWAKWAKIKSETEFFTGMFGSLAFLEIAYNKSLQQCLTSSRGITDEK